MIEVSPMKDSKKLFYSYPSFWVLNEMQARLGRKVEVGCRKSFDTYYVFANCGRHKATRLYTMKDMNKFISGYEDFLIEFERMIDYFRRELHLDLDNSCEDHNGY